MAVYLQNQWRVHVKQFMTCTNCKSIGRVNGIYPVREAQLEQLQWENMATWPLRGCNQINSCSCTAIHTTVKCLPYQHPSSRNYTTVFSYFASILFQYGGVPVGQKSHQVRGYVDGCMMNYGRISDRILVLNHPVINVSITLVVIAIRKRDLWCGNKIWTVPRISQGESKYT